MVSRINLIAAAAVVLFAVVFPAAAQDGAPTIGYVDVPRLIVEAPQGQDKLKKLEAEFAERRREFKAKAELFAAEKTKLEQASLEMDEAERASATRKLRDLQLDARRTQREYNEDYARRRGEELGELEKVLTAAIIHIAEREKFDLVLQQAIYASAKIDLTAEVLDELKKQHKKK